MLDLEESNDVQIPTGESDGEITFNGENEYLQPTVIHCQTMIYFRMLALLHQLMDTTM